MQTGIVERLKARLGGSRLPALCMALVLISGTFFVFMVPPFQVPDEPGHFLRAYELSRLQPLAQQTAQGRYGFYVPEPIHRFSDAYLNILFTSQKDSRQYSQQFRGLKLRQAESANVQPFNLENVAIYSPVTYVPQAAGLAAARALDLQLLPAFYLGRFAGLLVYAAVLAAAFWVLPRRAHIALTAVATLPTMVEQAASYSADSVTNSLVISLVACIAYIFVNCAKPDFRKTRALLVLAALVVLVALCKQVYVLLGLLAIPAVWRVFAAKKTALFWIVPIFLFGIAASIAWNALVSRIGIDYAVIAGSTTVKPVLQLQHIVAYPLSFLRAAYHTVALGSYGSDQLIVSGMVGRAGAQGAYLPEWGVVLAYIGFMVAAMRGRAEQASQAVTSKYLLFAAGVTALVGVGIFVALYVSFTAYLSQVVTSVNGRYFTPLAAMLIFVALWRRAPQISITPRRQQQIVAAIAIVNLLLIGLAITDRFIV